MPVAPWPAGSSTQAPCMRWWPPHTKVPTMLPSTALRASPRPWASSWRRRGTSPATPSARGGSRPAAPKHAGFASLGCQVPAAENRVCWAAVAGVPCSCLPVFGEGTCCACSAASYLCCALCRYVLTDLIKNQLEDTAKARGIPKVSSGFQARHNTGPALEIWALALHCAASFSDSFRFALPHVHHDRTAD